MRGARQSRRMSAIEYSREMQRTTDSQSSSVDAAATEHVPGSISFVVTSYQTAEHAETNLRTLRSTKRTGDEVVVMTGQSPVPATDGNGWFRVMAIPGASEFTLRAHIPAVCRKEWVVLVEDHALVTARTIEVVRELIQS